MSWIDDALGGRKSWEEMRKEFYTQLANLDSEGLDEEEIRALYHYQARAMPILVVWMGRYFGETEKPND